MKPIEIEELLKATRHDKPKIRKSALLDLCPCRVKANNVKIWDRLLAMRNDEDASVRSIVLHNLCDGSPKERKEEIVNAVEELAQDQDRKLRRRARNALAVYRKTGVINSE
ncbi:MAG: hypothetical protein CMQ28_06870 [Gammaproteobacteria bacterium]|nr:hypothetical protein [Gammaproteobacteria bacterium]|tara:strand:+ start:1605 stop:1937 length:333 start_codon:yes stop_codon:yes gene_type:complete